MRPRSSLEAMVLIAVLFCGAALRAQEKKFGDWTVRKSDENSSAKTVNDGKDELIRACGSGGCNWFVTLSASCTTGGQYNILINSTSSNAITTLKCISPGSPSGYEFTDDNLASGLLAKSTEVSIAFPLANGVIHVSRFSLVGMNDALAYVGSRKDAGVGEGDVGMGPCAQLSEAYRECKSKAEQALKKCAVWPGPGKCPHPVPTCLLPSTIDSRCRP